MTDRSPTDRLREADLEWLAWFARKSKGTVAQVVHRAIEQYPPLRAALTDAAPAPDPSDRQMAEGLLRVLEGNARYEDGRERSVRAIVAFIVGLRSAPASREADR